MNRPPLTLTLKFRSSTEDGRPVKIWLPLFIIVPVILLIFLALCLLVLPLLMVYVLLTWDTRWWRYLRHGVPAFFQSMHALLGLKVDAEDKKQQIYIDVN